MAGSRWPGPTWWCPRWAGNSASGWRPRPPRWARGTRSSPFRSTDWRRHCGRARRGYPPWAAGWTRTWPTSWPQRRPAGTPAAFCVRTGRSGLMERVDDVDHEHQGVVALDAGLGRAGFAVTLSRRDGEHHPAARGLADQARVPAGDDLLGRCADDEAERRARRPRRAEDLLGPPDVADILRDDVVALGDLRAVALDQRL